MAVAYLLPTLSFYVMESSSSTAIVAVLQTAKAACLKIISPVDLSAEKLGKENHLLQDKISVLEFELNNAKADNLILQERVNELQECNAMMGLCRWQQSLKKRKIFKEKLESFQKSLIRKHSIIWSLPIV